MIIVFACLLVWFSRYLKQMRYMNPYYNSLNIWDKLCFSCGISCSGSSSISLFQAISNSAGKIFISGRGGRGTERWAVSLEIFLIFLNFKDPQTSVRQLVRQLLYISLLLIITLCFTCGERKICSTIKNFQNISERWVLAS